MGRRGGGGARRRCPCSGTRGSRPCPAGSLSPACAGKCGRAGRHSCPRSMRQHGPRWDSRRCGTRWPQRRRTTLMRGTLLALLLALLTSCYARGTKIPETALATLVPGQTTYAEVAAQWGKPNSNTKREDGTRQVIYSYLQTQRTPWSYVPVAAAFVRAHTAESATVTLEFDAQDRLVTYSATHEQSTVGTGFSSGARPSGPLPR